VSNCKNTSKKADSKVNFGEMNRRSSRVLPGLFALFFCSGFAGLGYQIVWAKSFAAGIGEEYPATLAVITAFMCGLGLGGVIFARLPARLQSARSGYACLELLIGVWGVIIAFSEHPFSLAIVHLLGESSSALRHWTIVFSSVLLMLLPATAAMGATLPAIERLLSTPAHRTWTGALYALNTAGAMLGALAAAFYIMPALGLRNAILSFAAVNAACGLIAFQLLHSDSGLRLAPPTPFNNLESRGSLAARLILTGFFGVGFETLLIRSLSHILESTVYTFAAVLAVYLLGAALGAAIYQRSNRLALPTLFLGLVISCAVSAVILRWLPPFYFHLRVSLGDSLAGVATAEFLVALAVFLLPALCMGATFTALAEASLKSQPTLGWSVAWNSFGSALAPGIFGFFLVPTFGLKIALAAVVLGYAALSGRGAFWLVPLSAAFIPFITSGADLIIHPNEKIGFLDEGAAASVAVLESTNQSRVLKVNNRFQMGGTAARIAEERHADIPLLLHPDPRRALFIGLGTGITFATATKYPNLVADGVELLPGVVQAMPFFQQDPAVLANPALRVHIADGRRFALTTTNQYDVIVGDLFHPAQDGAAFLYTREHFTAVRNRLAPNGLFCQWLPLYQMDLTTVDLVANTFRAVFPYAELWVLRFNVDTPAIGLIGWREQPRFRTDLAISYPPLREHLRVVALGDALRLFGCRLGEISASKSGSLNTDDHPLVLFKAPYLTFREHDDPGVRLLQLLDRYSGVPTDLPIKDTEFVSRLTAYTRARDIFLHGLMEEGRGERVQALNRFIESARVSPDFTSGYAQALGIATSLARTNPAAAQEILRRLIDAQPARPVARELLEKLTSGR
jgi:spermidine synthase